MRTISLVRANIIDKRVFHITTFVDFLSVLRMRDIHLEVILSINVVIITEAILKVSKTTLKDLP